MSAHRTLLLVRHPEAQKNVEDRHGGAGSGLTAAGVEQCQKIVTYLRANYAPFIHGQLVGHNVDHVRATVSHLASLLSLDPIWDERLRGINLGVLAGLSRAEASARFPGPAERLELWRQGRIPLDRLDIPEAESAEAFHHRLKSLLDEWCYETDASPIVAVCTRSVLIMFVNLLKMGARFNFVDYAPMEFASGSITTVIIEDGRIRLVAVDQPVI